MLKIKTPLKKLSAAVALGLFAGTASASVVIDETYSYLYDYGQGGHDEIWAGEWNAGRFTVSPLECPNGCTLDKVTLNLFSKEKDVDGKATLQGVTLSVYSNSFSGGVKHLPEDRLLDLIIPDFFYDRGAFGTKVDFAAPAQDQQAEALLQPNTAYWLKLTNVSRENPLGWTYNGTGHSGQYWAGEYDFGAGPVLLTGHGSPLIFEVMGTNCTTCTPPAVIPVPGAIWLMGTAMIGLLASSRRKSMI